MLARGGQAPERGFKNWLYDRQFIGPIAKSLVDMYEGSKQKIAQRADDPMGENEYKSLRDPELAYAAMDMVNPIGAMTVFHGSPHKFSKFDMSKIGTGEGAQAYGHGLYFAENPSIAKDYQRNIRKDGNWGLQEHGAFDKLKNFKGEPIPEDMVAEINSAWAARGPEAGKEKAIELFDKNRGEPFSDALNEIAFYGNWEPKGNFYKVDIPDEHIDKMLDWDKPLSGQSEHVSKALKKAGIRGKEYRVRVNGDGLDGTMNDVYVFDGPTEARDFSVEMRRKGYEAKPSISPSDIHGGGIYGELSRKLNTGFAGEGRGPATELLKGHGIPGIKYLDGGSRGAGGGTRNFVLFDDSLATILERNNEPIGELAESLMR